MSAFNLSAQSLPPIAWLPSGHNSSVHIQNQSIQWPFFAVDIFGSMGVPPPTDVAVESVPDANPQLTIDDKLATLVQLGYSDEARNRQILADFNNDIQQAVNFLMDSAEIIPMDNDEPATSSTVLPSTSNHQNRPTIETIVIDDDSDVEFVTVPIDKSGSKDLPQENSSVNLPDDIADWALQLDQKIDEPEMEDCTICCNSYEPYDTNSTSWQVLECTHKLCVVCYKKILTTRTTMSGIQQTFVKCPFCHGTAGIEIGTCPDMQMNVSVLHGSCEGYEAYSTIRISYVGDKFHRDAFLPNNAEGNEVLRLLQIAFDRRLCFTVGTSNTTGHENVIVWNIHHKTSQNGGVSKHGYPDPDFLDRITHELKAFGIE